MNQAALTAEEQRCLKKAQQIVGHNFSEPQLLLSAITHPSAAEGRPIKYSYERLEFLGDSVLGAIVAKAAFTKFRDLDEGGLTRIKVALVAGSTLSSVAEDLGFGEAIIFGDSEVGTGKRGMHSALENVYEAAVAALYLEGGFELAQNFVERTLLPRMTRDYAVKPENPKSMLQEKLQTEGITPTYQLVETQGPPHDRTFVSAVFAGMQSLARGVGRTKKESESKAAAQALKELEQQRKAEAKAAKRAEEEARKAERRAEREARKAERRAEREARKTASAEEQVS